MTLRELTALVLLYRACESEALCHHVLNLVPDLPLWLKANNSEAYRPKVVSVTIAEALHIRARCAEIVRSFGEITIAECVEKDITMDQYRCP